MGKKSLNIMVGLNDQNFQKGLRRINKSLTRAGKKMQNAGRRMTSSITAPLVGIGVASVKLAVDFEQSMTKIQTLVGATASEMQVYSNAVASISSQTAVAQKDLADGLFFITSAGLSGQEAIDALTVSAKAGAMGMGEMDSIANALTSVMTAYADENMTAARAGDLLHETLKQGKFDAGQFMDKLGSVIPVAAAAGISMEELGAASATMSKLSGDAAGTLTSMKSLMMALLKPTTQQKEVLDGLGLSTDELGSMMDESLMGTLQFLFDNLKGNNEQLLTMFGSSKAVVGALSTMGLQADTYAQVLDGMNNSQGNVDAGMKILEQTAGHQLKQAFVDLQNAGIEIGRILMPVVLKLVEGFKNMLNAFQNLDSGTKKIIVAIGLVAAAIGPVLFIVGKLTVAFGALFTPVGLVIAALVAGGVLIYKNWDSVKSLIVKIVNYFIDLYNNSMIFRAGVQLIIMVFKNLWAEVKFIFNSMMGIAKEVIGAWIKQFKAVAKIIKAALKLDGEGIKEGAKEYADAVIDGYKGIGKVIADEGAILGEELATNMKTAYDNTMNANPIEYISEEDVQGQVDGAVDKIKGLGEKIKGFLGGGSGGGATETTTTPDTGGGMMGPPEMDMSFLDDVETKNDSVLDKMKKGWENWGESTTERIQNVAGVFGEMTGQMQAVSDQRFANEFANLDLETQKQIEAIESSTMSEEEKADKITDIEENADKKRKAIAQRQAKANKKFAIMNAIVNTAMAVTNALANIPAPFGVPAAIAMGVMGAAQVAAIASAPLPALAEGGLAFGPTAALVGDNIGAQSDPEVIAPLSKLNNMIGGQAQKIIVEGRISGEDIYLTNKRQEKIQAR